MHSGPPLRRVRTLLIASGLIAGLGGIAMPSPAQAATNGYNCRAEAVNLSLFSQPALRPLVAGSTSDPCTNDQGGLPNAGPSILPGVLGLDGAYAVTRILPSSQTAPAYQTAEARSGVADARVNSNGSLLRVQAVQAESTATCVNSQVTYRSSGRVAKLFVLGREIPINDGLTRLITGIDNITKALVHIRLNEETRDAGGYTFRALHVTVTQNGSLLNLVAGENRLNGVGSPCTDFTGTGGNPPGPGFNPGVRPVVGQPFGGGNVRRLKDIAGYGLFRRVSLCVRAKRYGRQVAIVGDNKRNNITGSKFSDRIFAYGSRDRLNGGSGTDCIEAGSGSDIINGGTGHDAVYGRGARDYIDGGAGRDRLFGGPGRDLIVTGSGRDGVAGGSGNDQIFTRDGRDSVSGGTGNDSIFAASRGRRDRIRCGRGRDRVRADSYDRVGRDCEVVIRR